MENRLKPCPFCGGTNFVRSVNCGIYPAHVEEDPDRPYVITCELYCDDCQAEIPGYASSVYNAPSLYDEAIANCYRKWNTRAERTCRDFGCEEGTNGEDYDFACSACGFCCDMPPGPNYCPNCGAKVVEE